MSSLKDKERFFSALLFKEVPYLNQNKTDQMSKNSVEWRQDRRLY